jgi:hypothetical protein
MFLKEPERENHASERYFCMELMEYLFHPDQGMWCGFFKGDPERQESGAGYEVVGASSGKHTLERLRDHGARIMTRRSKEGEGTASMESTRRMASRGGSIWADDHRTMLTMQMGKTKYPSEFRRD